MRVMSESDTLFSYFVCLSFSTICISQENFFWQSLTFSYFVSFFKRKAYGSKGENFFLAETMSAGHWPLRQQSHL